MKKKIYETVRKTLNELDLKYSENDGDFNFNIRLEHTSVSVRILCGDEEELLMVDVTCGLFAPADMIDKACRWICDKNFRCSIGGYTIDTQDGEISFRVSTTVDGGAINEDIVKVSIYNAISKVDNDYLELLKLLFLDAVQTDSAEGLAERMAETARAKASANFS